MIVLSVEAPDGNSSADVVEKVSLPAPKLKVTPVEEFMSTPSRRAEPVTTEPAKAAPVADKVRPTEVEAPLPVKAEAFQATALVEAISPKVKAVPVKFTAVKDVSVIAVTVVVRSAPTVADGPGLATKLMVSKPVATNVPIVVAAAVVVPRPLVIVKTSEVPDELAKARLALPMAARAETAAA